MESGHGWEGSHVTSFAYRKKFRRGDASLSFAPFPFFLTTTTMFAVARSLRSAVSRSGSYAVCPSICAPDVPYLPFLGPASFLNCEEHELKSLGYAYVSFFFLAIFTIL
jgi:hypothetical protein